MYACAGIKDAQRTFNQCKKNLSSRFTTSTRHENHIFLNFIFTSDVLIKIRTSPINNDGRREDFRSNKVGQQKHVNLTTCFGASDY